MAQNTIYKGRDNPVVIEFVGVDLTLLDDISVSIGADNRTLLSNPASVIVLSATELELNFQDTTETGGHVVEIYGIDALNPDGFLFTSAIKDPLDAIIIFEVGA